MDLPKAIFQKREVPETADEKLAFAKQLGKYDLSLLEYSRNIKDSPAKYKAQINKTYIHV